jgi:AcrR family transcriptional regulator
MAESQRSSGRKHRTRKDLLNAAARLMQEGHSKPTLEDVAQAALVSRATAYRYFPNIEALLVEASLDIAAPQIEELFSEESKMAEDAMARIKRVDAAFEAMMNANEAGLRTMLAHSVKRDKVAEAADFPARQNRRTPIIEAALEPLRQQFKPTAYKNLVRALAVYIGTESMIVFKDVLQLDESETRKVKRWAMRALIDAAKK